MGAGDWPAARFSFLQFRRDAVDKSGRQEYNRENFPYAKEAPMSRCTVTLTANAGCVVRLGSRLLLVDALHDRKVDGFSTVTPALWEQLAALVEEEPNALVFTHTHYDHFSPKLTARAREIWPGARVILPEERLPGQRTLSAAREREYLPGVEILFARLPHQGKEYRDVAHYGLVIKSGDFRILFSGDCALAAPELADFVRDAGPIDVAVLPFPWVTTHPGRAFLEQEIRPRVVVVNHLPFGEDDRYGYRKAAARWAGEVRGAKVYLLQEPLETLSLD